MESDEEKKKQKKTNTRRSTPTSGQNLMKRFDTQTHTERRRKREEKKWYRVCINVYFILTM